MCFSDESDNIVRDAMVLEKIAECFMVDAVKRRLQINECEVQRGIPLQRLFKYQSYGGYLVCTRSFSAKAVLFFTKQPVYLLLHSLKKNTGEQCPWY